MLFTADAWPSLADGSITVTFRTWSRPQAKVGGRYRVAGMLLEATDVRQLAAGKITNADARRAGATDADELRRRMKVTDAEQLVWRVGLRCVGTDDRVERRNDDALDHEAIAAIIARLDRFDHRAESPWTSATLALIAERPGTVSTDLAEQLGRERFAFKKDVRKLKELGLTESLDVGYRISPRGLAVLQALT